MFYWELASVVTKLLSLIASAGVVAGILSHYLAGFLTDASSQRVSRYILFCAGAGIVFTCLFFLVQIGAINQQGLGGMWDLQMGRILAESSLGTSTTFKLLAFVISAASTFFMNSQDSGTDSKRFYPFAYSMLGVAVVLLGYSFVLTGHVTNLGVLAHIAIALHIIAVFLWIGTLWPLHSFCVDAGVQVEALERVMSQFGKIATVIVALLIGSGIFFLSQLLESWSEILTTAYGKGILLKLTGVSALLALAALNKFRLVPGLKESEGKLKLARSIKLEMALAVFIVFTTAYVTIVIGM